MSGPILVVAAHPDDEVLGCGGTVARLAAEGRKVRVAILGEGITSRLPDRKGAEPASLSALRAHCGAACRDLGAEEPIFRDLPDNRFDTVPLLEVVKLIEALLDEFAPEVVYTHHGGDLNIDHCIVHRAVLTATRPAGRCPVREVYAFEVPSSTDWALGQFAPAFRPNVFVDVSATLDVKIRAMGRYESEARPFPHPRSPEALRANALRWGSLAGLPAAEALELLRAIR